MSEDADYSIAGGEEKSPTALKTWTVYLLECGDGTLYAGVTRDLERRLRQHNGELAGGARYTRGRRPVRTVWSLVVASRATAQVLESRIKRLRRSEKAVLAARGRLPALEAEVLAVQGDKG